MIFSTSKRRPSVTLNDLAPSSVRPRLPRWPRKIMMKSARQKVRLNDKENLLLVGNSSLADEVESLLAVLSLNLLRVASSAEAMSFVGDESICGLISIFDIGENYSEACEGILANPHFASGSIPVIAVIPDSCVQSEISAMYRCGVNAVFELPKQRDELPQLVIEALAFTVGTEAYSSLDRAIERDIKARIQADAEIFNQEIDVSVHNGVANLSGQIDASWKLKYLKHRVSSAAGVRSVMLSGVRFRARSSEDRKVQRHLRRFARMGKTISLETLDIKSDDGVVKIVGSAEQGRELKWLERLAARMNGVSRVIMAVVISSTQARRDKLTAEKISKQLEKPLPGKRVKATFFGGKAVIRGTVDNIAEAIEASAAVSSIPEVEQVENRLQVVSTVP